MSTDASTIAAPEAAASAAPALAPKNTNRLNRILRKPKASLPPRRWYVEVEGKPRRVGVPASVVRELISALTEEEKQRAAAGQDPLTPTQEALARRAARFGIAITSASPALPAPTFTVDEETLRRREERFKQAAAPQ